VLRSPIHGAGASVIYEYRVYEYPSPRELPLCLEVIEAAFPFFAKHGMKVIGCWTTESTISPNSSLVMYMLAFDDLAHLERCWKAMRSDEEWHEIYNRITANETRLYMRHFSSYTMLPTAFSPAQ
jgi:hypothetical protein